MQTKELGHFERDKTPEITQADLQMATTEGFERRYLMHLEGSKTCEEAYEKAAKDFRLIFKAEKYSSYNSFRVVKNRRLKTK